MDNMSNQDPSYKIHGIFPCPVYIVKRDSGISLKEKKDIKDVIGGDMHKASGGMRQNFGNSISEDTYIFNSKLKEIKQFCAQHIKIYVEQVISPHINLDFYITQSWLNVTKQGESHQKHSHSNSIISGVFYISTIENDTVCFHDIHTNLKEQLHILSRTQHKFNSAERILSVKALDLVMFPSWLEHHVNLNETTVDRISLSFNVFAKGIFGHINNLNRLDI